MPLAGSVQAAGRNVGAVESTIADRLASNFAVRPSVFVSVVGLAEELVDTFPIYVLGQVGAPGLVEVEPGTTLLQAVALSAGSPPSPRPSASSCAAPIPRPARSGSTCSTTAPWNAEARSSR